MANATYMLQTNPVSVKRKLRGDSIFGVSKGERTLRDQGREEGVKFEDSDNEVAMLRHKKSRGKKVGAIANLIGINWILV
jgi:hypothetical protein